MPYFRFSNLMAHLLASLESWVANRVILSIPITSLWAIPTELSLVTLTIIAYKSLTWMAKSSQLLAQREQTQASSSFQGKQISKSRANLLRRQSAVHFLALPVVAPRQKLCETAIFIKVFSIDVLKRTQCIQFFHLTQIFTSFLGKQIYKILWYLLHRQGVHFLALFALAWF